MNQIYVIARKTKNGTVEIYKPDADAFKPLRLWVTFDQHRSDKPDYRHKYITLNCYRHRIMWDKSAS